MLEYAPVPRIVCRGIYKNKIVCLQDFRAIQKKIKKWSMYKIVQNHKNREIGLWCRTDMTTCTKYPIGCKAWWEMLHIFSSLYLWKPTSVNPKYNAWWEIPYSCYGNIYITDRSAFEVDKLTVKLKMESDKNHIRPTTLSHTIFMLIEAKSHVSHDAVYYYSMLSIK